MAFTKKDNTIYAGVPALSVYAVCMMRSARSWLVPAPCGPAWLQEWLKRHQHPVSFLLHLIGIPMTILAIVPLLWNFFTLEMWGWASLLFLVGFALQYLGHVVEGNTMGELILFKRWLGKPYVAVSPRFEPVTTSQS